MRNLRDAIYRILIHPILYEKIDRGIFRRHGIYYKKYELRPRFDHYSSSRRIMAYVFIAAICASVTLLFLNSAVIDHETSDSAFSLQDDTTTLP